MHEKIRLVRKHLQCVHQGLLEILLTLYLCRKIFALFISILLALQGFPEGLEKLQMVWVDTV